MIDFPVYLPLGPWQLNPHQGFESLADLITFQLILRHRSRDPLPFAQRSFALMGGPMGGLAGACR
ncbi:MAG: hypothetical protein AAGF66_19850 [Cyanobacteria bacterium P01_H01_bin.119]